MTTDAKFVRFWQPVHVLEFSKNCDELPALNPHIMKEPGRSCLVESVLSGAEKFLQNISGHEQKPEWLGDTEPVQLGYCVTNTTGRIFVSPECERPVLLAKRQSQTTREKPKRVTTHAAFPHGRFADNTEEPASCRCTRCVSSRVL